MTDIGLYSLDEDGLVSFSLKNIDRVVSGPEEALQVAAYHVFTTVGSNTYNRDDGCELKSLISSPIKTQEEVNADAVIFVSQAEVSLLSSQSTDKPADATITGLKLLRASVSKDTLEVRLSIIIYLLDGNSFQATFRVT